MMDGHYCDDMPKLAERYDGKRMLRASLHRPVPTGDRQADQETLNRLYWRALTLWHEAGKPLPCVAHLGAFIRLEALP